MDVLITRRRSRAQSLVELSLSLPVLLFGLMAGVDLARGYAIQMAVQNGARAGAEAAAIDYTPSTSETTQHALDEMARTPGLTPANAIITVTTAQASGAACTYPASNGAPCYTTVRVVYTFTTITPWPWIPNTYAIDRTTMVRKFN